MRAGNKTTTVLCGIISYMYMSVCSHEYVRAAWVLLSEQHAWPFGYTFQFCGVECYTIKLLYTLTLNGA